jgi:cell volume regulation protein A
VLLVAVGAVRLSARIGVPGLLLYLAIGMGLGENGIGLQFDDVRLARDIGLVALALILAEGGLSTRWSDVRPGVPTAIALSTVGVAVSIGVTAVVAHTALDVDWRLAALLGAVVSSTDAAAVFSTLRAVRLPRRIGGVLEVESGLNDAPVVIVVTMLAHVHGGSVQHTLFSLGWELAAGAAIGLLLGRVATVTLRRAALPAAGLYPLASLAFAVGSYAAAATVGASGFLAVYLTALWLGNSPQPHRRATLGFAEGVAWLAQIGLFVMLGLLVTPSRLGHAVLPALAVGGGLLVLARPLAVLASATAFRVGWRDQVVLSWAGLRGAVPIVLATIPLSTGRPGATRVFDTVFVLVIVFTLVQAPTTAPLVRALGLDVSGQTRELTVEAAPLDELRADLLQFVVPPRSRMHNVEVWELRLPAGAAVSLVVRDGHAFVPDTTTAVRRGDQLLVVTTRADRAATEERLQAVSAGGRLVRFLG